MRELQAKHLYNHMTKQEQSPGHDSLNPGIMPRTLLLFVHSHPGHGVKERAVAHSYLSCFLINWWGIIYHSKALIKENAMVQLTEVNIQFYDHHSPYNPDILHFSNRISDS